MIFLATAFLATNLIATPGCNLAGDENSPGMAAAEAELAGGSYPATRELSTTGSTSGPAFDGLEVATNDSGQAYRSVSSRVTDRGVRIDSEGADVGWVLYSVAWDAAQGAPDTLHLDFVERVGPGWLGLADHQAGTWEWQQLSDERSTDIYIQDGKGYRDGRLSLVLAVHGGAYLTLDEGYISQGGNPPEPQPQPGPEPQPQPEPEPEPEPPPEPVIPAVNGAYISLGYWETERVDATFAELADHGVNLVLDYAFYLPDDPYWQDAFQHYLDTADAHGIGIAYWLARPLEGMTPADTNGHMMAALSEVSALKHQPAISAWYVHDEILPMISGVDGTAKYSLSLEQMQQLYDWIKDEDPTRPQLSVWNFLPDYELFNNRIDAEDTPWGRPAWMDDPVLYEQAITDMVRTTTDWVLIDMYPVGAPWMGDDPEAPELAVLALTQRAADLKDPMQPLAFVYQAFSWSQYTETAGYPFPTRAELDGMLSAARTGGADWAIAYSWFDLADDLPGRDVPGRDAAFTNLKDLLTELSTEGWPVAELPVGVAMMVAPVQLEVEPVVYEH